MYQLTQISASAFRKKEIPFPDWNKFDLEKRLLTFETSRSGHDIDNTDTKHRFFDHSELSRRFRQECRRLVVPSQHQGPWNSSARIPRNTSVLPRHSRIAVWQRDVVSHSNVTTQCYVFSIQSVTAAGQVLVTKLVHDTLCSIRQPSQKSVGGDRESIEEGAKECAGVSDIAGGPCVCLVR